MRSKVTAIALALVFSVSMAGVSLAKSCKGKVVSNEGKKMVIELKKACSANPGDEVKVKVKAKAAVEGC